MFKSKVFRNASWLIGCRIIQSILNLIISTLTARYMGPSNFGIINYASSVVAFFAPLMHLGITNVIVEEIISRPECEEKITGTAMLLNVVSALFNILGVFAFTSIVNRGETETIIVCTLYSINLVFLATEILRYWYQAKLKAKYVAIISLFSYAVTSAYKIFLLATAKNIYWFAVSYAIEYALISIALFIVYKRRFGGKLEIDCVTAKRLLTRGRYYIISDLLVAMFSQVSKVVLKLVMDEASVGIYSTALTCSGLMGFVFAALTDSFRPMIFSYKKHDKKQYEESIKLLYSIIIFICLAQAIVVTVSANWLIAFMYGSAYAEAAGILRILIWMIPFGQFGVVRNIWILAEEKQKYLWIINLCGAIFSLTATVLLIHSFGLIGAAVAALVTQVFTNVILSWIIKPLQANNRLMLGSLNPKVLLKASRRLM